MGNCYSENLEMGNSISIQQLYRIMDTTNKEMDKIYQELEKKNKIIEQMEKDIETLKIKSFKKQSDNSLRMIDHELSFESPDMSDVISDNETYEYYIEKIQIDCNSMLFFITDTMSNSIYGKTSLDFTKIIYSTKFKTQMSMENVKKRLLYKKITSSIKRSNKIEDYYFNNESLTNYVDKIKSIFEVETPQITNITPITEVNFEVLDQNVDNSSNDFKKDNTDVFVGTEKFPSRKNSNLTTDTDSDKIINPLEGNPHE